MTQWLEPRLLLLVASASFIGMFLLLRNREDVWHPVNLVFYLFSFQYLIPALLFTVWPVSSFGARTGMTGPTIKWAVPGLLLVQFFLLFFWLGANAPGSSAVGIRGWSWFRPKLRLITYAWSLGFAAVMLVYLFPLGGLQHLLDRFAIVEGTGWITWAAILSTNFLPMLLWTLGRRWLAMGVAAVLSLFFMASGGRLSGVLVIFWILLFVYHLEGKKWINWLALGIPVFLAISVYVVVAPFAEQIGIRTLLSYNWQGLFQTEVGRLEQLAIYLRYSVQESYFDLGRGWLVGILGPVLPQILDYVDYRNVISAHVLGLDPRTFRFGMGGTGVIDLWMLGAIGGVMLGAFVYGLVWKRVYTRMNLERNAFYVLLYIQVSIVMFQAIHEGRPVGTMWFTLIPFGLVALLAGVRRARSTA